MAPSKSFVYSVLNKNFYCEIVKETGVDLSQHFLKLVKKSLNSKIMLECN